MYISNLSLEYSKELQQDVIYNFSGLLDAFDCKEEIEMLEISAFHFIQRKNMVNEIKGLYTALWNMALCRSFPEQHDIIFQNFLNTELPKKYGKKKIGMQITRINQYIELLTIGNNDDFTPISHHLLSLLDTKEDKFKSMNLKIALHIRKTYSYIFERLF